MFFIKFFYFLKGYVIIRVESLCVERFISICIRRGIRLLEIDKRDGNSFLCVVSNNDFRRMLPVVHKTKAKVSIVKKYGLNMLIRRLKNRMGFVIGAAVFPIMILVMSQFVWSVQVNGVSAADAAEISQCLEEWGISRGMLTCRMPSASDIKIKIMARFDDVSWAWVYSEGTRVRVEVRKGRPVPELEDIDVPCDIVAARSGIITEIVTERGSGCVRPGSAVSAGDILIAGTVENKNGGYYTVHAQGSVYANTSQTVSDEFPMYRDCIETTGECVKRYTLKFFAWDIPLFKDASPPFEHYTYSAGEWDAAFGESFYLGFGLKREIYEETLVTRVSVPYDTAVEAARFELEKRISENLLPGAVLDDSRIYAEKRSEDVVYVSLTMNFTEKIGTQRLFE